MKELKPIKRNTAGVDGAKRRAVPLSRQAWVETGLLQPGMTLPLVVRPALAEIDLAAWAEKNLDFIEENLLKHGAILFRDFSVNSVAKFERFVRSVAGEMLEYREHTSPRTRVTRTTYTSTEYPSDERIELHNENSYQRTWPLKFFFYCLTPADSGGATPFADCRKVLSRIGPKIAERFMEKGWMLVRNFGEGLGLSWQDAFYTTSRAEVEEYCRNNSIEFEWRGGDRLRTRQVRPAIARHPRTGEMVWFNHIAFFHVSGLKPDIREMLLSEFKEEELAYNTYYGDGTQIEPEVLEEIREAYTEHRIEFPWHRGDLLMLDNMLVAHGRAPFTGPRKILVAMADPFAWERYND